MAGFGPRLQVRVLSAVYQEGKTLNPSEISRWREYLESQTIGSVAVTPGENAMYWVIQITLAKLEVCAGNEPMNE